MTSIYPAINPLINLTHSCGNGRLFSIASLRKPNSAMRTHVYFLLIVFLLAAATNSFGQTSMGTITGEVVVDGLGVENISVSLFRAKDSALVKVQVSGKNGKYSFNNLNTGSYFLSATAVGFKKFTSQTIAVNGSVVEVAKIELQAEPKALSEVKVASRKSFLEMKADKMVVNVDASPTNAGSSALEVLEKSPGVTVDKDGNISLKGKQGVTISVDGRPSYLSGADLANLLRGMNASQLDQIEIMSNPPAKYDASGNSGVINIKTKKIKTVGFNGSVSLSYGQGVYPKTNEGINLNYKRNKLNVFGSFNHSYRGGFQDIDIDRNIINRESKAVSFSFQQRAYMPDTRNTISSKFGIDYDISKKTSASIVFNTFNTRMTYDNNITNTILDHSNNNVTTNLGRTYMTPNVTNNNIGLNLRHKLDTSGAEINFDGAYVKYTDKHKQSFYNSFYDNLGNLQRKPDTLKGNLPTGYNVYALKVDFTKPLKKQASFESGAKISYVTSDNNIMFDSLINGNLKPDEKRTNHFIYKENVYAAYANYSTPLSKKLKMQAGLRYEYTEGEGRSITNNTTFNNRYGQFFPTLFFGYTANEKNQFNLNYGRRITRPQYRDLNPFIFIIDQYTFQRGNPNLQPQFSHNVEVSHSYNQFLTTTLNYSHTNGVISEVVEANELTQEASLIKRNIAKRKQLGLAVNLYKPLTKWVTIITNANVFHNRYQGALNDTIIDLKALSGNFYAALQFKFDKGWDAEINGFYNTRGVDGISIDNGMGMFSLAASKAVLKNSGKVTLNVRDPFALQFYRGRTKIPTIDATVTSRWENRIVTVTFNYRFGKQFKTNKRSTNSAAEEQGRIGG